MSAFYPTVTGRTSAPLAVNRMLFQIHSDQSAILDLQTQLSTGKRIQLPSQDPSAAIKILSAQRQQEFRQQTEANLRSADGILTASETSLSQAQMILNEVRAAAVEAAGNTLSAEQRTALGQQVDQSLQRIVDLANSKHADQFIFGGSGVRESPMKLVGDRVRFTGNQDKLLTIADYATPLAANVNANDAFGVQSSRVVGTADLNPSLAAHTPLTELNGGAGVRLGAIRLSSGLENVDIDLSNAYSVGDILNQLSSAQLGGRQLSVNLSANGINVTYEDGLGGLLRIEDVGGGVAARDLGISNIETSQSSPVLGSDLNPRLTPTTLLSQLFGGSGLPAGESLRITQSGSTYVVSTNGLETVEDLLNRIQQSGASIAASIDPSGRFLTVQNKESGSVLSIGENGTNLATLLGIRSMSMDTPLSSLNSGAGIGINELGNDLILTRNDGTTFAINLSGAITIGDVINRINNNVENFGLGRRIVASLESVGNGIRLSSNIGAQPISVASAGGSQAASGLGWANKGQASASGNNQGSENIIGGRDVNGIEVEGIFSTLIRLSDAIREDNPESIQDIWKLLDQDLDRLSLSRGLVGFRQQAIDSRLERSLEARVQLKQVESDHLDADLASVISDLTHRQAALQASLQMMGQTSRMTLFDFL
jgi:flagellar hook-associated protein 3 FlgL